MNPHTIKTFISVPWHLVMSSFHYLNTPTSFFLFFWGGEGGGSGHNFKNKMGDQIWIGFDLDLTLKYNSPFSFVLHGPSFWDAVSVMSCALFFYILVQISPVDRLIRGMIKAQYSNVFWLVHTLWPTQAGICTCIWPSLHLLWAQIGSFGRFHPLLSSSGTALFLVLKLSLNRFVKSTYLFIIVIILAFLSSAFLWWPVDMQNVHWI